MKKCYKDVLFNQFPNCRHITCFAHILNLVGECWRLNLKSVDKFISLIKMIFCKSPSRRRRWIEHLKSNNVPNPTLPPSPVIVRWNTWSRAAIYHAKHYEHYQAFISNERLNETDTEGLISLDLLLQENVDLKEELEFVKESSKTVFFSLLDCQEDNLSASEIYSKLLTIDAEFSKNKYPKFNKVTNACKEKLHKYLYQGGQPSINLFKSVWILNPVFFKMNQVDVDDVSNNLKELIPCLEEIEKNKILTKTLRDDVDIKEFWLHHRLELPKLFELAKIFLHFPISTAAVERSFSKYNQLLTSDR